MTAVTPTDCPKSVRNSCVIKVFGGLFMLSGCFLDCSVGVGVFVTVLCQISSFFSSPDGYIQTKQRTEVWDVGRPGLPRPHRHFPSPRLAVLFPVQRQEEKPEHVGDGTGGRRSASEATETNTQRSTCSETGKFVLLMLYLNNDAILCRLFFATVLVFQKWCLLFLVVTTWTFSTFDVILI